jgi:hypothetical protein
VLKKFGECDWQLATLICQALWNYCIESTNLHAALGIDQTNQLLGILVDFLGEVTVQESSGIRSTWPVTNITKQNPSSTSLRPSKSSPYSGSSSLLFSSVTLVFAHVQM